MTITEFLQARLDEEEAYAREPQGWNEYDPGDPGEPSWLLRDVEAKRRIAQLHRPNAEGDMCMVCTEVGPHAQGWPCQTLYLLASVYSDHPDYQKDWRPRAKR